MNTKATVMAGGFLLVAVGLLVWQLMDGGGSGLDDDPLADLTYEKSAPTQDREAAAVSISRRSRAVAVPQLRRIAREDPDPTVRAAAIAGLGEHYDYQSMDLILDSLESGTYAEQVRARRAAARMIGPRIEVLTGSEDRREKVAADAYRRMWSNMKNSARVKQFQKKIDRTYGELP